MDHTTPPIPSSSGLPLSIDANNTSNLDMPSPNTSGMTHVLEESTIIHSITFFKVKDFGDMFNNEQKWLNRSLHETQAESNLSWFSSYTINALMISFGCLSLLVTIVNICLLVASKFASGGRTPMLIFLRSLCVADALTAMFGVVKMTQFIPGIRWGWVNCFLPESLLFTATIASNLTHVMLSSMCFSMLKDMVRFDRRQDKHRSIFSMTFLWNGSFVMGFVPHMDWNQDVHMGWNSDERDCLFLSYFTQSYLVLLTLIIGLSILCLIGIHIALQVVVCRQRVQQEKSLLELTSQVIKTTRVDMVLQLVFYLPGTVYVFHNCQSCAYVADPISANANLSVFIPLMITRATFSTLLHFKRTEQMRDILKYFLKVCKHHMLVQWGSKTTIRPVRPSQRNHSRREPIHSQENGAKKPTTIPYAIVAQAHILHQQPPKKTIMHSRTSQTLSSLAFSVSQPTISEELPDDVFASQRESLSSPMASSVTLNSPQDLNIPSIMDTNNSGGSMNGIHSRTRPHNVVKQVNHNGYKMSSFDENGQKKSLPNRKSPYWVGEIPRWTSKPLIQKSPDNTSSPLDMTTAQLQPHRLLWTSSPMTSHILPPLPPLAQRIKLSSKLEKTNILSAENLEADLEVWNSADKNTLQSEVVVHVSADK